MQLNFRAPETLLAKLKKRGGISAPIREGLERYYRLLDISRERLRGKFSDGELSLLVDISKGTFWGANDLGDALNATRGNIPSYKNALTASAEDCEDAYYEKWNAERDALLGKLRALSPTDVAAIIDALERFWAAAGTGIPVEPARLLDGGFAEPTP